MGKAILPPAALAAERVTIGVARGIADRLVADMAI
jgi:hypothetical protein